MTEEQKIKRKELLDKIFNSMEEFNRYNISIWWRKMYTIQELLMVKEEELEQKIDFKY